MTLRQQISPFYHYYRSRYFPTAYHQQESALQAARVLFYRSLVEPGDLVFDVGANLGKRVEVFLQLGAKVVAVEPQPYCCRFLHWRYGKRIQIERVGLSASSGQMTLFQSDQHMLSSFSPPWIKAMKEYRFSESNWDKPVKVNMTTLDLLIQKHGVPAFCKIDVEGFEYMVLRGLSQPIPAISFEYSLEMKEDVLKTIDLLLAIYPSPEFNFVIGESTALALDQWMDPATARSFFQGDAFLKTGGGDIYIRGKAAP